MTRNDDTPDLGKDYGLEEIKKDLAGIGSHRKLNIKNQHVLNGTAARNMAVPVLPEQKSEEQTQADKWIEEQNDLIAIHHYEALKLATKAGGQHPTKKPGSARVRAKLKAQKKESK